MTAILPNHPFAAYCSQAADASFQAIRILGPHITSEGLLQISASAGETAAESAQLTSLERSISKLLNIKSAPLGIIIHALESIRTSFENAPEQIRKTIAHTKAELLEPYCQTLFSHFYAGLKGGLVTDEHQRRLEQVHTDLAKFQRP